MSFSSEIKEKLSTVKCGCKMCDKYFLAGFMGNSAKISQDKITLVTENKHVAKVLVGILNRNYLTNVTPVFISNVFKFEVEDNGVAIKIIEDTGYIDRSIEIKKECCKGAFARGAFMGGGSINDPQKSYHLEIDYKYPEQAQKLVDIFDDIGAGVKTTERKGHTVVYVKEYEVIAGILGFIGAGAAAIEIYNISAEKEIRNGINRQINCESANMDKIAEAYCKHLQAIEKIKLKLGFDKLPETLREAAEIRLKFPEDSLKELGERFNPPIGKSGVNHRLNRLIEIAENL